MNSTARIFFALLGREIYIFKKRTMPYIINYAVIYPLLYSLCFGYLIPLVSWGPGYPQRTTIVFIGCASLLLQILAFVINADLVFDFEGERFVEYQVSLISPPLVLILRILFSTLFCTLVVLPFYPLTSFILNGIIDFSSAQWGHVFLALLVSCFFFSALNIFGLCAVKGSLYLENLWVRFFHPMIMLGGLQVPWATMGSVSPFLKYGTLCNPMLYVSEGLRVSLVPGRDFISFWICIGMLLFFSILFSVLALHFFRKKLDHI